MKIIIIMLIIILINGESGICGNNCEKCKGDFCDKCEDGYIIKDGKCFKYCENCEKCENEKCLRCEAEYVLVNDKCYSILLFTQNLKTLIHF
jgi:hypothetical protein